MFLVESYTDVVSAKSGTSLHLLRVSKVRDYTDNVSPYTVYSIVRDVADTHLQVHCEESSRNRTFLRNFQAGQTIGCQNHVAIRFHIISDFGLFLTDATHEKIRIMEGTILKKVAFQNLEFVVICLGLRVRMKY